MAFPVVQTDRLTKDFVTGFWRGRRHRALDSLTLEVPAGGVFGLLGPNGAGKSTTLKLLVDLLRPTSGTGRLLNRPLGDVAARRRLGFLPEQPVFYDHLTAEELLEYFAGLFGYAGGERRRRVASLLDRVGLDVDRRRPLRQYSKGMLQRVGLAQALVNDPELVILDEPTAGLDAQSRRDLRAEIAAMRRDDRTVLLTTHDIEEVEMLCDRIAIIDRGRIVATGTPAELTARSTAVPSVIATTTPNGAPGWLDGLPDADGVTYDGANVRFRTRDLPAALAGLLARTRAGGLTIAELHVQKATLEDVLIELTRHDRQA